MVYLRLYNSNLVNGLVCKNMTFNIIWKILCTSQNFVVLCDLNFGDFNFEYCRFVINAMMSIRVISYKAYLTDFKISLLFFELI